MLWEQNACVDWTWVRRRGRLVATITYRHHLNSEVTAQSSGYRYAQIYLLKLLLNQEMYLKTTCSKDHIIFVNHNAEWSLPISRIIRCDALHWERNLTTLLDWILIDFCVNVYSVSPCSVAYSDTLKNLNAISIPACGNAMEARFMFKQAYFVVSDIVCVCLICTTQPSAAKSQWNAL